MTFTTLLKGICIASICVIYAYKYLKKDRNIHTKATMADKMIDNNELKSRMDRIIDWVKTCDTKASIMLTLVCLVLSFIFTSDFILSGYSKIFQSLRLYVDTPGNCSYKDISISAIIAIASMAGFIYYSMGCVYRFILVLYSKIEESQDNKDLKMFVYKVANVLFVYKPSGKTTSEAYMNSLVHFNNIANYDNFDAFKAAMNDNGYKEDEDLLSQIYINANRCQEKFNDYNAAIRWMLYSIPFLIPLFISVSVFMTYRA